MKSTAWTGISLLQARCLLLKSGKTRFSILAHNSPLWPSGSFNNNEIVGLDLFILDCTL